MNKAFSINRQLVSIRIPIVLLLALILLVKSTIFESHSNALSIGVTFDLVLTIPFVYFLLIRNTTIPKTTVVPILILGVIVGSLVLPAQNQYYLDVFKVWVLPVVEVSVFTFVLLKARSAVKNYGLQKKTTSDFFTALKSTCYEVLPRKVAMPFATEVAVIYYAFISWGKKELRANDFTYHKHNGTIPLLAVMIFLILVETFVVHILLVRWSIVAAWILSGLSTYTAIQIFGFIKSIPKRPITIEGNKLRLR